MENRNVKSLQYEIICQVMSREGGYSDHASDSGGKTKYGITETLAKRHGFKGQMHEMPRTVALQIYQDEFWHPRLDDIAEISPILAAEIFDTTVNIGPKNAAKFVQRSLNVLNREETDFSDIKIDGVLGSKTVAALKTYLKVRRKRGEGAFLTAINCLQGAYYITLTEKRRKEENHLFGWLTHRIILQGNSYVA